jgi:uncharacterized membrane protein
VSDVSTVVIAVALVVASIASAAALYGHYAVLPAWLTGPEICKLEDGGCAVLFRSPRASVFRFPNAALGLLFYALLAAGLILQWPASLLVAMSVPAVAMSAFLGWSLIVNHRQCRICWTGHVANAVLFVALLARG